MEKQVGDVVGQQVGDVVGQQVEAVLAAPSRKAWAMPESH